ncbi:unnamed protein product, partial [Rotaria sordida]
ITQNDLNQYLSNQHILNRSFLSTSIDREVAEMFAGEGQQSKMRYTPKNHCALQYSCLCQYLIKQNSTAINIQSLSTRPDEKEILILPFTVFKVIAIKQNYLNDPTASISIEIELEECEDPNDNKNESENSDTPRTSLSSISDDIKDVEEYQKFKQRKRRLYSIIGLLVFAVLSGLTFIFIFIFVIQKNFTPATENDDDDYPLPQGCPNISNRSSWNARPYKRREKFASLPVTHIVVHQLGNLNSIMNHQDCINEIKEVQNQQMDNRKWEDIGFNFLLCDDSDDQQQIYTGRGWKFIGAHCIGHNPRSLAINIQSLSTRPDEKEILILPFTVFKVIAIKQNYLDDPTASISIEIELEECEDPNDNKNESENSDTPRTSLSSTSDDIKDVEEYIKFKQRKRRLYGIIGFLLFAILLALTFIFIFIFVVQKNSTKKTTNIVTSTNMNTPTTENDNDDDDDDPLPSSCPNILKRSSWNAVRYEIRKNLTLPVTDIVIHELKDFYPIMTHQDCINKIKGIQEYQMGTQTWDDIGFNFLLCDDSDDQQQIYTGRGWKFIGAHCMDYNPKSLGIGIIGNNTSIKSVKAFKSLIQCGIKKGDIMTNFTLVGHLNSRSIYEYYLQYFRNDTDLQYSNQVSNEQFWCTPSTSSLKK